MSKIVVKFGGTSVANIERILNAAKLIKSKVDEGHKVVVVVSAMSGVTNDLIKKSKEIDQNFDVEEYDALLSTGEQVTSALFAGALKKLGLKSRSWLSWQIPIVTEGFHSNSRIVSIETTKLNKSLDHGEIPVVPGFQGVSKDFRLSTLGRGGSDASAVALAKCIAADYCEIYTDVDGVYTTNPAINPKAKKIEKISYEEMLEMASLGAKVMQSNSVQQGMMNNVEIHVRSTFTNNEGTSITSDDKISYDKVITGVAYSKDDAKITLIINQLSCQFVNFTANILGEELINQPGTDISHASHENKLENGVFPFSGFAFYNSQCTHTLHRKGVKNHQRHARS